MGTRFLIFFSTVLVIWGSANYYVFIRGWQAISNYSFLKKYYIILILILGLSYILGRILENFDCNILTEILIRVGTLWMVMLLYFFIFVLIFDIIRLFNYFFNFLPTGEKYIILKNYLFILTTILVSVIVIIGMINANTPIIKKIELKINKYSPINSLNIVAVSDIHLGTLIGEKKINKILKAVEEIKPDLILLAGDVIDEDVGALIKKNLGEKIKELKAKYGVYAIPGNHEYISGINEAIEYLTEHNIIVLRDSVKLVDSAFYLIGRDDRSSLNFANKNRKSIEELTSGIKNELPIIMLDHQPFELDQVVKNGIDLQISGHTHHGQLWPFNYITEKVYELSWGYLKKGNSHFYVSSGFGTWGPPARLGNKPEIVNLILTFNK